MQKPAADRIGRFRILIRDEQGRVVAQHVGTMSRYGAKKQARIMRESAGVPVTSEIEPVEQVAA